MFQFPTGWNSTGLEIVRLGLNPKFQFPTGWNSTPLNSMPYFELIVSIPNGMEFYPGSLVLGSPNFRFNSQRDGILLSLSVIELSALSGFNSQRDVILPCVSSPRSIKTASFNSQRDGILLIKKEIETRYKPSFNSQRDGILQKRRLISYYFAMFQFPTGWNSTVDGDFVYFKETEFQFPTGWNSTRRSETPL